MTDEPQPEYCNCHGFHNGSCRQLNFSAQIAELEAEVKRLRTLQPWADDVSLNKDLKPTGHVEWLIQYLLTVHKRFGNTAVVVEGLRWGASALWAHDELVSQLAAHREAVRVLRHAVDGWRQYDDADPMVKGECLREARERTTTALRSAGEEGST